ncbi:YchJ family metal-binding protein [Luteimonas sp. FCS-9]|uniref:YchJ family protein n=1 Tax=Luteimonas sp. FCS-9 TaxID=1547516 RepID=UPI00063E9C55|nr:YchJ family metal-binding protein [Luteimonas sp. FCS-9]KLI99919.1 hypothetical protein WQ56_11060 [Luteimonas sp. FCS-9]
MPVPDLPSTAACPCGRRLSFAECCGVFHAGTPAPDAETLMRARYSAYVRHDADYLWASWHPRTRPADLDLTGPQPVWLGLDVLASDALGDDRAEVEFVARYRVGGGSAVRMRERSRFVREDGHWYYVDGDVA